MGRYDLANKAQGGGRYKLATEPKKQPKEPIPQAIPDQEHVGFLHRHPALEAKLGLDFDHIVVDKKDWWEIVRHHAAESSHRTAMDALFGSPEEKRGYGGSLLTVLCPGGYQVRIPVRDVGLVMVAPGLLFDFGREINRKIYDDVMTYKNRRRP